MYLSLDSLRLSVREVSTEREREKETGNSSWTWEVVSQSGLAKVVCQRGEYRERDRERREIDR